MLTSLTVVNINSMKLNLPLAKLLIQQIVCQLDVKP